jgi:hypothetical protein
VNPKLLLLLILTVILSAVVITVTILNKPLILIFNKDTKVGGVDLSGMPYDKGLAALEELFEKPIYLNYSDSSRTVNLRDMGIDYDQTALYNATSLCRQQAPAIFCRQVSVVSKRHESFIIIDKDKLSKYLDSLEKDYQFIAKNTIISFDDFSFRVPSEEANVMLDRNSFEREHIQTLVSTDQVRIQLNIEAADNPQLQQEKTNRLISTISQPLLIKYGRNPIRISSEEINSFIETKEIEEVLYGFISEEQVSNYLNSLHETYATDDVVVMHREAVNAIRRALLLRAANEQINIAIILPLMGNPKTDGSLHDVYLEIVKSQQRLYRFEKGELVKTYIISTGLTWETPSGEFKVLGKQKMTISYFGNWYMPDYLPIGLINGQYKFGFHAIPYHMDGRGNIYSRDPNTMGSPATGGCIQLTPEEATELFEWAEISTPVYIYE